MGFNKIHNVSKIQLNVMMFARFIMITICAQLIFRPCRLIIKTDFNQDLSMLKLTKYLLRNTNKIGLIMEEIYNFNKESEGCMKALAKFCTYEKRKRRNYQQKTEELFR